jgi:DNA-binding transcriptional MocR family regulator
VARRDLARDLVARLLPGWGWTEPSGGFALWLRMPSGDGDDFTDVARAEGVTVLPGSFVSVDGGGRDHVRLALIHDEPTTVEAVTRLARAWRRYVALGDRRPERSERAVI